MRWSSSQQHSHVVRAFRPTRTKSTFCRQSSIKLHSTHTQGAFSQRRCGESPSAKLQRRVSSEDCRTPVCGQAVKQSSEMRSALEFFATAQSCRERSLESVNRVADIGFSDFVQVTGNTTFFRHFGFFRLCRRHTALLCRSHRALELDGLNDFSP